MFLESRGDRECNLAQATRAAGNAEESNRWIMESGHTLIARKTADPSMDDQAEQVRYLQIITGGNLTYQQKMDALAAAADPESGFSGPAIQQVRQQLRDSEMRRRQPVDVTDELDMAEANLNLMIQSQTVQMIQRMREIEQAMTLNGPTPQLTSQRAAVVGELARYIEGSEAKIQANRQEAEQRARESGTEGSTDTILAGMLVRGMTARAQLRLHPDQVVPSRTQMA